MKGTCSLQSTCCQFIGPLKFCMNIKVKSVFLPGIAYDTNPDVDKLPHSVSRGNFQPVKLQSGALSIVTFDLETKDLGMHCFFFNNLFRSRGVIYTSTRQMLVFLFSLLVYNSNACLHLPSVHVLL